MLSGIWIFPTLSCNGFQSTARIGAAAGEPATQSHAGGNQRHQTGAVPRGGEHFDLLLIPGQVPVEKRRRGVVLHKTPFARGQEVPAASYISSPQDILLPVVGGQFE